MEPAARTVKKNFFISYTKADRAWAAWIAWHLEDADYSVVFQEWDFRPGENIVQNMQSATANCERTIAVLSPDYLTASFTHPEWQAAFWRDPKGENGVLLPIRVRKCELPGLLAPIAYINLIGLAEDAARVALLAGIKTERVKPATAPIFPSTPRVFIERPAFPDTLPAVWNIELLRNPNFTGREDLLDELESALTSGQAAALTQAIIGLGGVGKTQLALEYAYRHMSEYAIVWWLRSDQPATLAEDYSALGVKLGLPIQPDTKPDIVRETVRQKLSQSTNWLLVFDNAGEPSDITSYVPQGGYRHVIISSRNPNWGNTARPLSVTRWKREDSLAFLQKSSVRGGEAAANAAAEALGDLPLALEQAAAYCQGASVSLGEYVTLFRKYQKEMLPSTVPSADYQDTFATTWDIALQKIRNTPLAAELLNLCAFLAPINIPRDLFKYWTGYAGPIELNRAIAALRRYSLVEATDDMISVHQLVQAVTRDRLPDTERGVYIAEAVNLINNALPVAIWTDAASWETCARLLPHALAAAANAETRAVPVDQAGRLLNSLGSYLNIRAEFEEARKLLQRALNIDEKIFGLDHPSVAKQVNDLGGVLHDLGNFAGAKECYERALEIDIKTYGPNHPNVASDVNNLGSALQDLGRLDEARECYERALRIDGPDSPTVAIWVNNLGTVLKALGELEAAKECYERALRIDEAAYGTDHLNVAIRLNNLGTVLQGLGDLNGAKECYERALEIGETAYGPDHPTVAIRVNNLGGVLKALGNLPRAKKCFERALRIGETVYGLDHPVVAVRLKNLGGVLKALADLSGARECYERALRIDEKAYSPDPSNLALDINNLGSVLQDRGDRIGAKQCYERALRILRQFAPDDDPRIRWTKANLESVLTEVSEISKYGAQCAGSC